MKSYCDRADNSSAAQFLIFWKEGGASRALIQGAGAAVASIAGGKLNELSSAIAGADPTGNASMNEALGNIVANAIATGAGGAAGGESGAFSGYNVDRFNRQLHPEEKTTARQIAANAAAQGITNPDGSPITVDQIENAMRAANDSQYGEIAATGVVVPLNSNTPASAVYDTTGMKLVTDSTGSYLAQDPAMLATPSQVLQNLIVQNTGGANSPYSWNPAPSQTAIGPKIDATGPFTLPASGCITAECAAGIPNSDPRNNPNVSVQAGFHIPISPGIAVGPNFSYGSDDGAASLKPMLRLVAWATLARVSAFL
ncbi:hypothetical protein QF002_008184 [Paraburkholderia youngii]